jgi:hypothetical protein
MHSSSGIYNSPQHVHQLLARFKLHPVLVCYAGFILICMHLKQLVSEQQRLLLI